MTAKIKKSRKNRFYSILLGTLFVLASASASYFWSLNNQALSDGLDDLRAESIDVIRDFHLEKKGNGLYQSRYTYVSELQDTIFPYNAVGVKWEGELPEGTSLEVSVRASNEDIWHLLEPESDGPSFEITSSEIKFFASPRSKLQYRVMLSTNNTYRTPEISKLELHYFNYGRKYADEKQAANLLSVLKAEAADEFAPRIITREEWGANEAFRVYHEDNTPAKIISEASDEDAIQYANELIVVKEIDKNEQGQDLTWPEQYPLNISHIIVHHTAMDYTTTLSESIAKVRDIYYWHTIVKGWGDIGYNYLIDPLGNIFEGRAGSDQGSVGAHAAGSNVGSIGISVMGDYRKCEDKYAPESEEYLKCLAGDPDFLAHDLTPEAEKALADLIAYKSAQYGINPMGKSAWRGKIRPNVLGHRDVRKTACPGQNIYDRLVGIRAQAAQKYFELLPNVTQINLAEKFDYKVSSKALYELQIKGVPNRISAEAGETIKLPIRVQNTGSMDILKNSYFEAVHTYEGIEMLKGQREQLNETIKPDQSGIFQLEFKISPQAAGSYTLAFYPVLNLRQELKDQVIKITLDITGSAKQETATAGNTFLDELAGVLASKRSGEISENPTIRVRISKFEENNAQVSSTEEFTVSFGDDKKFTVKANELLEIRRDGAALEVDYQDALQSTTKPIRLSGTVLTVDNMQAPPAWNPTLNDNSFRNTLEFRSQGPAQNLLMINELPLEDYLKGVAEVPNGEPLEKNNSLAVISRGYAYYYLSAENRKYPGQPYDASDDPETFQKYLGYNFESRNADWQQAVSDTYGQMLTFDGKVVKTPYFNQSDGRTRSAEEVWGWTNTPYLQSVPDPFCKGLELKGHGVGLSGRGATEAAKQGKNYEEILQYYYKGVELERIYGTRGHAPLSTFKIHHS
ncbi:MAG: SpoIID/LytB domain-containing protein [Candidatus Gracilibacteria bacterium]|nr:SpoIID/LytB domain-containing protein [Candidatus Gracilibacteria bacterium]